jgi:hypothetical protein
VPALQPVPEAPGLVLRDGLAGVGVADLHDVLDAREPVDSAV